MMEGYAYICPESKECRLHKKCHVLTTVNKLEKPLNVMQLCPAAGRDSNGKKIEIKIAIG